MCEAESTRTGCRSPKNVRQSTGVEVEDSVGRGKEREQSPQEEGNPGLLSEPQLPSESPRQGSMRRKSIVKDAGRWTEAGNPQTGTGP